MEHINIKGIIFDYGGTIDSRGDHWSEIIWKGYQQSNIAVTKEQFRECYVYAERELARVEHIKPNHNFYDLLIIKMRIELQYLIDKNIIGNESLEHNIIEIASYCYAQAKESIADARKVLDALYAKYPMVLVSNFYGNVESVLTDFDLRKYFKTIIESAVVGVRKPNPQIFQLGVNALNMNTIDVLVIGDSYKKDIIPAESIGCKVLWLKGKGWTEEEDAMTHPMIIKNLAEILDVAL
ncbi:MAG: HAD family hydrolase [Muribaculaceae bacterium]